jgi:di/tricarboxylate transporter
VTIGLSGFLSAFLVNDVVCVAMTPLVVDLCRRLKRRPIPYLVGLATASNVGSVATITGKPQNMIIGLLSGILRQAVSRRPGRIGARLPDRGFGLSPSTRRRVHRRR